MKNSECVKAYSERKNTNRTFILQFIFAVIVVTCISCNQKDGIEERPVDIINTSVKEETLIKIANMFPENVNARVQKELLFASTVERRILLTKESEVYITYVSEGARYHNSVGYYAYLPNSTPVYSSDLKINLLFPNVSKDILIQGDMLQLGNTKFPAGTIIGFFLVVKGWEGGAVHYENETFYTDVNLNFEAQQQHVLFKLKDFGDIILGFEDIMTLEGSDEDFNDIIFTVSDNRENREVVNFDFTNVVQL